MVNSNRDTERLLNELQNARKLLDLRNSKSTEDEVQHLRRQCSRLTDIVEALHQRMREMEGRQGLMDDDKSPVADSVN